jgi:hypothetical protein
MAKMQATFKQEDAEDGEMVGPLIVWDPEKNDLHCESDEWMRESQARKVAEEKGWEYSIDGQDPEEFRRWWETEREDRRDPEEIRREAHDNAAKTSRDLILERLRPLNDFAGRNVTVTINHDDLFAHLSGFLESAIRGDDRVLYTLTTRNADGAFASSSMFGFPIDDLERLLFVDSDDGLNVSVGDVSFTVKDASEPTDSH